LKKEDIKMKKPVIAALALGLGLVLSLALFVGCGSGNAGSASTADDPAAGDDTADASAGDDESYVLTYSYFTSESIGPGLFITQAAENIAERSNGRLTLDMYFNGTLLGAGDVISGCINGTADIVTVDQTIMGEVFPLSNIFSMPFIEIPPSKPEMDAAFNQLLVDRPELNDELAKQGLMYMGIAPCGGYHLHGTSILFDSPAKLAGKTIEGLGEGGNIITAMGGNGVSMDPGDWYLSLSTGLLDGQLTHFAAMNGFATSELLTTHVVFSNSDDPTDYDALFGGGIYAPMMGNLMNKASFDALPPDLQEILVDELSKFAEYVSDLDIPQMVVPAVDLCLDRGDTFVFVGDEEREAWIPGMQVIIDKWVAQVGALGYDGQAIYDHLLSLF
jgi:TRAP-type C4-dicarboxylate transport system substrate-binding protein